MNNSYNNEPEIYAVYGTLRLNQGNYRHILKDNSKYIKTTKIKGFDMFSLGGFPGIVEGNNEIVVDLFEVNDPTTKHRLDRLEGYSSNDESYSMYLRREVEIEGNKAWIYIWNSSKRNSEVLDNDWVKHINS